MEHGETGGDRVGGIVVGLQCAGALWLDIFVFGVGLFVLGRKLFNTESTESTEKGEEGRLWERWIKNFQNICFLISAYSIGISYFFYSK